MILNSFMDFDSQYFLEINGFGITWYAMCILTGIIIAVILGVKEAKRFNLSQTFILDGVLIIVPCCIIGARLYYILFALDEFVTDNFVDTFFNMIGFNNGRFALSGLSITGAVIVAILGVIIYARKKKVNPLVVFDFLAPGLLIGQICGRWGNFFNQEAHGGPISAETFSWLQYIIPSFIMDKMYIGGTYYHPTFLYEGLWNTLGFILILISRRKNKKARIGDNIAFYLIWYGLGRSLLIEPFRTDPLMLGDLRINIIVPLIFAVIGTVWIILKHTKFNEPTYIALQEEIKSKKIDGVITKLDDVLVDDTNLIKNAYYYTVKEFDNKDLTEEELEDLVEVNPNAYFSENKDALSYYNEYIKNNIDQLTIKQNVKDFYKLLFKHDYGVVVISKHSLEYITCVLEKLKIMCYVSIIVENADEESLLKARNLLNEKKNILYICSKKEDIEAANSLGIVTALVNYTNNYNDAVDANPNYIINRFTDFSEIIVE